MSIFNTIVNFFQDGGLFMYPIVAVLMVGLFIGLERWLFLSASKLKSKSAWKQLVPAIKSGDLNQAANVARGSRSAIGNVLSYGIDRARTASRKEDIEMSMEEGLMEELPKLEQRTHYLATFANVATLLGLLGTIIGLIRAFTAVAGANPAEKADLLSASISVAMNTTAFGLIVAIPLLLMHTVLMSKTGKIVDSIEIAAVKFLNSVNEKRPQAQ